MHRFTVKDISLELPHNFEIAPITKVAKFQVYRLLNEQHVFILYDLLAADYLIVEYDGTANVDYNDLCFFIRDIRALLSLGLISR